MVKPQPLLVSPNGDQTQTGLPLFPSVRYLTSVFAIITACYFIFVAAIILYDDACSSCATPTTAQVASSSSSAPSAAAFVPHPASSSSWWWAALVTKCYALVGAGPVVRGLMWRSPPQAALALLLLAAGRRCCCCYSACLPFSCLQESTPSRDPAANRASADRPVTVATAATDSMPYGSSDPSIS